MYGGADLEGDSWLVVLGQWCCVYSWLCSNELYVSMMRGVCRGSRAVKLGRILSD